MVGPHIQTTGVTSRIGWRRSERAERQTEPPSRKSTNGSDAPSSEDTKQQQHDAAHPGPEDGVRLISQPGTRERDPAEEQRPTTPGANRKSRSRQPTLETQTAKDQKPQQLHDASALPVREQASERTAPRDETTLAPASHNGDPQPTKTVAGEVAPRQGGPGHAKGHPYSQDRGSEESHQLHGPGPNPPPKSASKELATRDMPVLVNSRIPTAPNGAPERTTMLGRALGGKLLHKGNKKDATKHGERVDPRGLDEAEAHLRQSIKQQQEQQTAQLHELHRQIQAQARELHHSREEYASTKQLLDDRTKELAIAQQFLTTADSVAEADVIRIVGRINDEILQTAALLAETLPHATRRQPEPDIENDAWHAHAHVVDTNILKFLHDSRKTPDPSLVLQIAVQTYLASTCARIASAWHPQDDIRNAAFKEVYQVMRQTSEPLQFSRSNRTEGDPPKWHPRSRADGVP